MIRKITRSARAGIKIARRARNPLELARAVVPALRQPRVLNASEQPAPVIPADELIRSLRDARNALKSDIKGGGVDYETARSSEAMHALESLTPSLVHLSPDDLPTDAARTAFFINLYNVLAIHGVLALDIRESVMEIPSFFNVVCYQIGEEVLSLDQIEHGLLRCNRPHPSSGRRTLAEDSPSLAFAPETLDPRIHMALVCAAASCPPVGFYDPERLDWQLDMAAGSFVDAEVFVTTEGEGDGAREVISWSTIFHAYAVDWGEWSDVEAFALHHAAPEHRATLEEAMQRGAGRVIAPYDWSLNMV